MITVKADIAPMNRALQKMADQIGKDAPLLIATEFRLFCLDAIKETPAKTQKVGRESVKKSGIKAHPELKIKSGQRGYLDRAVDSGNVDEINKALERFKRKSRVVRYSNQAWQGARQDGRVKRYQPMQSIATKQDIAARDRDIARTQKKVGTMRAAYVPVIRSLDRITGTRSRISAWYSRQDQSSRAQRWLGSNYTYNLKRSSKTFVRLQTGTSPFAVKKFQSLLDRRTRAISKKSRALARGAATWITGKGFKINERIA